MEEWFRSWFGSLYEELYRHRDPLEAARQVASLLSLTGKHLGPVLDAGCGGGRHLGCLREQGCQAFGLDLSSHLLARAVEDLRGPVVCADLRSPPFHPGAFGLVASFFTGFGYLDTPEDDARFFHQLAALVKPGGWLFLDLPNPARVRQDLVARDERAIEGGRAIQEREIVGNLVIKTIRVERVGQVPEQYFERVRLWEIEDIDRLATACGLISRAILGDSEGSLATPESPRQAFLWRKE